MMRLSSILVPERLETRNFNPVPLFPFYCTVKLSSIVAEKRLHSLPGNCLR